MNKDTLMAAFALLAAEGSRAGSVRKSVVDKVLDSRLTRGKSRKGAKHKEGSVFKSISHIANVTPARYRRLHLGCIRGETSNGLNRYYQSNK